MISIGGTRTVRLIAAIAVALAIGVFTWRMWPDHLDARTSSMYSHVDCVLAGGKPGPESTSPFSPVMLPTCALPERWIFGDVPEAALSAAIAGVVAYLALVLIVLGTRAVQGAER